MRQHQLHPWPAASQKEDKLKMWENAHILNAIENWEIKVCLSSFSWRNAANHASTILDGRLGMESTLQPESVLQQVEGQHTCFPVKPWQMTLVSLLIFRDGRVAS